MKRLSMMFGLVAFGLVLLASSGVSQDTKKDKKEGGKIKGMLPAGFKGLGLSKAQIEKIYSVQIEHRTQIADLTAKINELKSKETKEVFKVLTDEQREKYLKSKGVDTKEKKDKDKG